MSATAAAFASTFVPEDEPVLGEEQQRVDLLGLERPPSGGRRRDYAASRTFASSNGCAARSSAAARPARRRRRHRDPVGLLLRERRPKRGRAADEREHESVETRNALLRSRSRISRRATSVIARRPLIGATSSRKSSASVGGP